MIQYIYTSKSVRPFTSHELMALLEKSWHNNQKSGLTGMLLYKHGDFMQVLEGEEAVVRELSVRIASDPRHKDVVTLQRSPCVAREFPDWSMGFHDLSEMDPREIAGYTTFMDSPLRAENFLQTPSLARTFLLAFKGKLAHA